jgi:hypothetical protein
VALAKAVRAHEAQLCMALARGGATGIDGQIVFCKLKTYLLLSYILSFASY